MKLRGFFLLIKYNNQDNKCILKNINEVASCIKNAKTITNDKYVLIATHEFIQERNYDDISIIISEINNDSMMSKIIISKKLEIYRDFWGTKNIYHSEIINSGIIITSDIRLILSINILKNKDIDLISLTQMSLLGYIYDEDRTLFQNIKQLPRNSLLTVSFEGKKVLTRLQNDFSSQQFNDFAEFSENFKNIFDEEVKKSLNIQGDRIHFLSGGMDSTALAVSASKNEKINTLSFISKENSEDEYYSDKVSFLLNTNHIKICFNKNDALTYLPEYLYSIESFEPEGIFSPLGGFAYFLMCKKAYQHGFNVFYPGEGADEILGGYYWPLTHSFGFADKLKEKTAGTVLQTEIERLFSNPENRLIYRINAYKMLQGTALTNYHLSCVEHIARFYHSANYPVFMSLPIYDAIKCADINWLCDGKQTKIVLRDYLSEFLRKNHLEDLAKRKKLAMPSVITLEYYSTINSIAKSVYSDGFSHPYSPYLGESPLNKLLFDIFYKYFVLNPLSKPDLDNWNEDLNKMVKNNEPIIHW